MTSSVKQAAERYGVSQHSVLAWIASGELNAIDVSRKVGGKPRWRITAEALQSFELIRSAHPVEIQPRRQKKDTPDVVKFY